MSNPRHQRIADYLRGVMAVQRLVKTSIAAEMDLPPQTFSRKINGKTPFTLDELDRLIPILGTTWVEVLTATEADSKPLPPGVARDVERAARSVPPSE